MSCSEWKWETVESARGGAAPPRELSEHLAACPDCAARWQAEVQLSHGFGALRAAAGGLRSSDAARMRLLAQFDEHRLAVSARRRFLWALASTAALLLAALWIGPWTGRRAAPLPPVSAALEDLLAEGEFVPVPYAPPLAQGEIAEVVRMDLTPAALARMGFAVQSAYENEVTADLVVGDDGLPRAVRVVEVKKEAL